MSESIRVTDLSESSNNGLTPTQQQVLNTTNPPQAFKLPSGRTITFKKPSGIASLQTAKLLGVQSANQMLTLYYRAGLSIASLNGKPVSPPKSELEMAPCSISTATQSKPAFPIISATSGLLSCIQLPIDTFFSFSLKAASELLSASISPSTYFP